MDYEEKSPLHFAAANGLGDGLKMLVDAKANVQAKVSNSTCEQCVKANVQAKVSNSTCEQLSKQMSRLRSAILLVSNVSKQMSRLRSAILLVSNVSKQMSRLRSASLLVSNVKANVQAIKCPLHYSIWNSTLHTYSTYNAKKYECKVRLFV